jgi:protein-arginine kinase activator protein McsA
MKMKKVVENFVCENCGFEMIGDGTTDHCSRCLWGKHVDEAVPGAMEPIKTSYQNDKFRIYYKCTKCNHDFWVNEGKNDNRDLLIEFSTKLG